MTLRTLLIMLCLRDDFQRRDLVASMLHGKGSQEIVLFAFSHAGSLNECRIRWMQGLEFLKNSIEILIRGEIAEAVAAASVHQCANGCDHLAVLKNDVAGWRLKYPEAVSRRG